MKQYVTPEIEIYKFSTEDIIVASGGFSVGGGEVDPNDE